MALKKSRKLTIKFKAFWEKVKNFFRRKKKVAEPKLTNAEKVAVILKGEKDFEFLEEQYLTNDTTITHDNNYDYQATYQLPQAFQCGGVENAGKILKVDNDGYIRLSEGGGTAVYYIELSGTSGTLNEKQKAILLSGEPTLNYINKDNMIFKCVFYGSTKAVYSIAAESKNHVIEINTNTGVWKLTTYNLAQPYTAGDNISIENNVISAKDVLTTDRFAISHVYSQTTFMKNRLDIVLPNKMAWLVIRLNSNPEYGSKPFYVDEDREAFIWGQDVFEFQGGHFHELVWDSITWRFYYEVDTNLLTIRCSDADTKMFAIAI